MLRAACSGSPRRFDSDMLGSMRTNSNISTVGAPRFSHLEVVGRQSSDEAAIALRVGIDQHEVRAGPEHGRMLRLWILPAGGGVGGFCGPAVAARSARPASSRQCTHERRRGRSTCNSSWDALANAGRDQGIGVLRAQG